MSLLTCHVADSGSFFFFNHIYTRLKRLQMLLTHINYHKIWIVVVWDLEDCHTADICQDSIVGIVTEL